MAAKRPVFGAQVFPIQPQRAAFSDGLADAVGQGAGKGLDHGMRFGSAAQIGAVAVLPAAQTDVRMLSGIGDNPVKDRELVQPEPYVPIQTGRQFAGEPPGDADVAEVVDNVAEYPAVVRAGCVHGIGFQAA